MALKIRLRKQGSKNAQTFRLVVMDERVKRDGAYVEMLGWYLPQQKEDKELHIKEDRIQHWLDKGAVLSESAKALVKKCSPEVIKSQEEKKRLKRVKELQKKKGRKKAGKAKA